MFPLRRGQHNFVLAKEQLTKQLKIYMKPGEVHAVTFYCEEEDGGILWVPRFYAGNTLGLDVSETRFSLPLWAPGLALAGALQETTDRPQVTVFNKTVAQMRSKGGATVIMPCGTGKTNTAIAISLEFGARTAVLCHTTHLLDQWAERLESFAGGGSRPVRIGRIKQEECTDGDFVLCSIQSLLSRKYPASALQFGLVVIDECHHISAPSFSRVLQRLQTHYLLGLTATPERKDKLECMIYALLGDPSYVLERRKTDHVQVTLLECPTAQMKEIVYRNGVTGCARMLTNLTLHAERNRLLVEVARRLSEKRPHSRGLLLSDRVDHLRLLHARLGSDLSAVICGKINTDPVEEGKEKFRKFLTLSTYGMFSEGVDFPGDFIILATPRSSVEQSTGRILRGKAQNQRPVIIDLVDPLGVFYGMAKKRERYYVKRGYEIHRVSHEQILRQGGIDG